MGYTQPWPETLLRAVVNEVPSPPMVRNMKESARNALESNARAAASTWLLPQLYQKIWRQNEEGI
jgi:hypothetical protein